MTVLLSIIIPTFNADAYLEDCLSSVASQLGSDADVELIVQDGGSTDRTHQILEKQRGLFAHVDIRADHGQSDAIDRGIQLARGRFVTWLNADDVLMPGALKRIRGATNKFPSTQWWIGGTVVLDSMGKLKSATRAARMINNRVLRAISTYGPSSLFTKQLYDRVGGLDLSFHYMMDTDLWHRFAAAGFRYQRLPGYLWGFRQHEESKTTAHMFTNTVYDPFAPSEYRQNAERLECYLRHGIHGDARRELVSFRLSRLLRVIDLSLPRQLIDQLANRGRHWNTFRPFV